MELQAVFEDGSWIQGIRHPWYMLKESKGTHHLFVTNCSMDGQYLVGYEVAIPINKPKYWLILKKGG